MASTSARPTTIFSLFFGGPATVIASGTGATELWPTWHRNRIDLTHFNAAKILPVSVGGYDGEIAVQYSLDNLSWDYLDDDSGPFVKLGGQTGRWVAISSRARRDVNLRAVCRNGDGTTSVTPDVYLVLTNTVDSTARTQLEWQHNTFTGDYFSWTPSASADQVFWPTYANQRLKVYLADVVEARIVANVKSALPAGATLKLQYSTDDDNNATPTWTDLGCSVLLDSAPTLRIGLWTAIDGGAAGLVALRAVVNGGDGATALEFGGVSFQFRTATFDALVPETAPIVPIANCGANPYPSSVLPPSISGGSPASRSVLLAEMEIGKELSRLAPRGPATLNWTVDGTWTNLYKVACDVVFDGIRRQVVRVDVTHDVPFVEYSRANNKAEANDNELYFYHDAVEGYLYVHFDSDITAPEQAIVIAWWQYFDSNVRKVLNRHVYSGLIVSSGQGFETNASVTDGWFEKQQLSGGDLHFANGNGFWDAAIGDYWLLAGRMRLMYARERLSRPAEYSEFVPIRKGVIGTVERTDVDLVAQFQSAVERLRAPLFTQDVIIVSDDEYPELTVYADAPEENIGAFFPIFFGETDTTGSDARIAARGIPGICVDIGDETEEDSNIWTSRAYKFGAVITNPETGYEHGFKHVHALYNDGVKIPASKYTMSENNTLATFDSSYEISGDAVISFAGKGYQDDDDGTFTHTANHLIEWAPDIIHFLCVCFCRIRTSELYLPSLTRLGTHKQGVAGEYAGQEWSAELTIYESETGGISSDLIKKKKPIPQRESSAKVEDLVVRITVGEYALFLERFDGLLELVPISDEMASGVSDGYVMREDAHQFSEIWSLDSHVSEINVLGPTNPTSGIAPKTRNKRKVVIGGKNVRDKPLESVTGQKLVKEVPTYIRLGANRRLLANVLFRHAKRGAIEVSMLDVRGKLLEKALGERVPITRDRMIGGSKRDRLFLVGSLNRDYGDGRVQANKLYQAFRGRYKE